MATCTFLTACELNLPVMDPTSSPSSGDTATGTPDSGDTSGTGGTGGTVVTPERDIYFNAGETYNLAKQLEYEGKTLENVTLTITDVTKKVQEYVYDCDAYSLKNGVITIKAVETTDYTTDTISVKEGEETSILNLHVVNKEKYGYSLMTVDVGRLYGKTVIFFGDSITDQDAVWWKTNTWQKVNKEGEYYKENGRRITITGITKNYVNMLDEVCHFASYANPAIAGALCSHYNAAYANKGISIPTQISQNLDKIKKADYVFVMGGTNDSYEINKLNSVLRLGTIDDLAEEAAFSNAVTNRPLSTFYGFYNYILNTIEKTNPNAGLICLSNIPCQSTYGYAGGISNGHNNEGIQGVNAAIKNSCEKYLACYVDIYSAIPFSEKYQQYISTWFTNDQLHPNEVAYELITDKILSGK